MPTTATFRRGDRISARDVNDILRRLATLENLRFNPEHFTEHNHASGRSISAIQDKKIAERSLTSPVKLFQVSGINYSESLLCFELINGQQTGSALHVAKPWFLRGSATWNGKQRFGVTYNDYQNSHRTRTGTKLINGVNVREVQTIVPTYTAGDQIVGVSIDVGILRPGQPTGGTDTVKWLDLNVDGRMWAKV